MKEIVAKANEKYRLDESVILNVSTEINPDDEMLGPGPEGQLHYFNVGLSCMYWIQKSMILTGKDSKDIKKILDFPCGYGRVLRFLKVFFPDAEITGSEIEKKYVDYCEKSFGVKTFISGKNFSKIQSSEKFDLIWCGSLFTHLNSRRFRELLKFFYNHLNNNGLLVFSSHGRYALKNSESFDYGLRLFQKPLDKIKYKIFGFAYSNYGFKFGYGVSFVKPSWICSQIQKIPDLKLYAYIERAWDNHQDIIVCKKENFLE